MQFPNFEIKQDFDEHFKSEIWLDVAREICRRERVYFDELKRLDSSDHVVFSIDEKFVLKIYRPARNCFEREMKAIEFVGGKTDFTIPEIIEIGEIEKLNYVLMTQISGIAMTRADWLKVPENEQILFAAELAKGLKQIHALRADSFESDWKDFVEDRAATFIERQIAHGVNRKVLDALPEFIEENLKLVTLNPRKTFMHADVHFGNMRLQKDSKNEWQIAGLFDFADSRTGFHEYEFLAVGVLMFQGQGEIQREFFKSYGYAENELDEQMRRRLMMLTMLYETADLRRYALRLKPQAVEFSLDELEKGIWSF